MTRYEQGFLNKCAEYGVDGRSILYKRAGGGKLLAGTAGAGVGGLTGALASLPALLAAGAGAGLGTAMAPRDKTGKKNRLKGALIGALLGIPTGGALMGGTLGGLGATGLAGAANIDVLNDVINRYKKQS